MLNIAIKNMQKLKNPYNSYLNNIRKTVKKHTLKYDILTLLHFNREILAQKLTYEEITVIAYEIENDIYPISELKNIKEQLNNMIVEELL